MGRSRFLRRLTPARGAAVGPSAPGQARSGIGPEPREGRSEADRPGPASRQVERESTGRSGEPPREAEQPPAERLRRHDAFAQPDPGRPAGEVVGDDPNPGQQPTERCGPILSRTAAHIQVQGSLCQAGNDCWRGAFAPRVGRAKRSTRYFRPSPNSVSSVKTWSSRDSCASRSWTSFPFSRVPIRGT
jgi:hypothetical protein